MTSVFFVRHAQPVVTHEDDRTRPLTPLGLQDSERVTEALADKRIERIYASPYQRSMDTVRHFADAARMEIHTDERLREREAGAFDHSYLAMRWADFDFHEEGGESLRSVQERNMQALEEILGRHPGGRIAIATHGTALSTILNRYDPAFGHDDFVRILNYLPYVLQVDFAQGRIVSRREWLILERGYGW